MRRLTAAACLSLAVVATPALASNYNLVDSTGKIAGEIDSNSAVTFTIGGQAVAMILYNTGYSNLAPDFYYTEPNCTSQKLIFASGLVNNGYVFRNAIYFGSTAGEDVIYKSSQYFNASQNKYICSNQSFGGAVHVAPARVMPLSVLKLTPPFSVKPK